MSYKPPFTITSKTVSLVRRVAPPYLVVPELMENLFNWLKTIEEHPLIVSCIFHYEFEFIHPFSDGKGRIGRFLQSVILTHYKKIFGFIPISYKTIKRDFVKLKEQNKLQRVRSLKSGYWEVIN